MLILRLCRYLLQTAAAAKDEDNEDLAKTAKYAQAHIEALA